MTTTIWTVITPTWYDMSYVDWFQAPWFANAWFGGYGRATRVWDELPSASNPTWSDLASASTSWGTISAGTTSSIWTELSAHSTTWGALS